MSEHSFNCSPSGILGRSERRNRFLLLLGWGNSLKGGCVFRVERGRPCQSPPFVPGLSRRSSMCRSHLHRLDGDRKHSLLIAMQICPTTYRYLTNVEKNKNPNQGNPYRCPWKALVEGGDRCLAFGTNTTKQCVRPFHIPAGSLHGVDISDTLGL